VNGSTQNSARLTTIWLGLGTTDVTMLEEVLIYDFTAIVAAVGGSLGLFIGFSFLDVFKAAIDKLSK
jgi:FtsH-binding integral membrane protein